jgi:hypothetical protein
MVVRWTILYDHPSLAYPRMSHEQQRIIISKLLALSGAPLVMSSVKSSSLVNDIRRLRGRYKHVQAMQSQHL